MQGNESGEPPTAPLPAPAEGDCDASHSAHTTGAGVRLQGRTCMASQQRSAAHCRVAAWLSYWLPPLLLMGIIFYLSDQPDLPRAPQPWLDMALKKLGHAAAYALLFLLLRRAWLRILDSRRALPASLVITAAYAVSDELHQAFVPGRHANVYDVVIDLTGVLLLWWLLRGRDTRNRRCGQDEDVPE